MHVFPASATDAGRALVLVLVLVWGCRVGRPGQVVESTRSSSADGSLDPVIQECKEAAAGIRHLHYTAPVRVSTPDRARFVTAATRRAARNTGEQEGLVPTLVAFGLIPDGFDLQAYLGEIAGTRFNGYYDPGRGVLMVPTPARESEHEPDGSTGAAGGASPSGDLRASAGADARYRGALVHEFVHALQWQNLNVAAGVARPLGDLAFYDDARLARIALVEGDATFVAVQYLMGEAHDLSVEIGLGTAIALAVEEGRVHGARILAEGPGAVRDIFLFPYLVGLDFVARLLREHGWDMVNGAHGAPPVSTEQVLHPTRYLAGEQPDVVTLHLASAIWDHSGTSRVVSSGTWGELGVRVVLRRARKVADPDSAAEGWGGDRFVLMDGDGQGARIIWAIAWDSTFDARAFVQAWRSTDDDPEAFPVHYGLRNRGALTVLTWGGHGDLDARARTVLQGVQVRRPPPAPPRFVSEILHGAEVTRKPR